MEKITLESLTQQFVETANEYVGKYKFVSAIAADVAEQCYNAYTDSDNDPTAIDDWLEDLSRNGVASGMVPMFVYTTDCREFYLDNVLDMDEWLDNLDFEENPNLESPRFCSLCWFAYEYIAMVIHDHTYLGYATDED